MKRVLKILTLGPLALIGLLVLLVNLFTPGLPEITDAELAQPIQLEDGTVMTVGELVAREIAAEEHEAESGAVAAPTAPFEPGTLRIGDLLRGRGAFNLGLRKLARGRTQDALAIWRAIPSDHHDYARAQRFIGYKIYDRQLGEPAKGVAYVNRSLWHDPLSGNAWQDAYRIYLDTALSAFR